MSANEDRLSSDKPSPLKVILFAGLATGVCDISAAFLHAGLKNGVSPIRVLKFVASGLIGDKAFAGGYEVAVLGLGLHFLIALIWAAIYYGGSRNFVVLTEHPFVCGMIYGILVHNLMRWIVVPLSLAPKLGPDTTLWNPVIRYLIHMFCVGLPMALVIARFRRREGR